MVVLASFGRRQLHMLTTLEELGCFVWGAVENGHVLVKAQPHLLVQYMCIVGAVNMCCCCGT